MRLKGRATHELGGLLLARGSAAGPSPPAGAALAQPALHRRSRCPAPALARRRVWRPGAALLRPPGRARAAPRRRGTRAFS